MLRTGERRVEQIPHPRPAPAGGAKTPEADPATNPMNLYSTTKSKQLLWLSADKWFLASRVTQSTAFPQNVTHATRVSDAERGLSSVRSVQSQNIPVAAPTTSKMVRDKEPSSAEVELIWDRTQLLTTGVGTVWMFQGEALPCQRPGTSLP